MAQAKKKKALTKGDLELIVVEKDKLIEMQRTDLESIDASRDSWRERHRQSQERVISLQDQLSIAMGSRDRQAVMIRELRNALDGVSAERDAAVKERDEAHDTNDELVDRLNDVLMAANPRRPYPPTPEGDAKFVAEEEALEVALDHLDAGETVVIQPVQAPEPEQADAQPGSLTEQMRDLPPSVREALAGRTDILIKLESILGRAPDEVRALFGAGPGEPPPSERHIGDSMLDLLFKA